MIIRRLNELSRADVPTAGGKGANLGEMIRLGLPVPPGFVVSTGAYAEQARAWGLAERLRAHLDADDFDAAASEAAALLGGGDLLSGIEGAIRDAHRELGATRVAVRSSATAEDLAGASFAGQQETYLDVAGEDDVLASIRRCWASLFSPRALHYRRSRGIPHLDVQIAVVVQRMVPAEAAGVLFTVDPVEQRSDRMLLSAAPGLGEVVVSGHRRGDTYRLRREPLGAPGEAAPGRGADGLAVADLDLENPGRPALDEDRILEIGRLGLALEAHFACPQDVEFAVADGRVFLLQSRPITTLGTAEIEPIEPLGDLDFLQERGLGANLERFPIAPKPLDRWLLRRALGALAHMARYIGFAVSEADEQAVFGPLWREAFLLPRSRPTLRLLGVPARVARGLGGDWGAWWRGEPSERLRAACPSVDFAALEDAEIVRLADRAAETFGELLGRRFEPMLGLVGLGALGAGLRLAVGAERAPAVLTDLLGGLPNRTTETNQALFRLAKQAVDAGPGVADAVRGGRAGDLRASAAGQAYLASVEAFLAEYGHREGACLYLSTPTWRQDPEQVWGLLRGILHASDVHSELHDDGGAARHRAALAEVEQGLRRAPALARAFRGLLERVRGVIAFREDSHFDLTRPVAFMQGAVAEIGRRLHERGSLPAPADVFYLTDAEVGAWLAGGAPARDEAEKLLARRRATYQAVNGRWQKRRAAGDGRPGSSDHEIRGTGASAGVARARARIVRGEHQFDRLQPGEILVCAYTNPSWTPLFRYAAGVVTDTGSAASHAAIVAREYGIPAVMGAAGATERIRDGQEILVDGTEGRVVLLLDGAGAQDGAGALSPGRARARSAAAPAR